MSTAITLIKNDFVSNSDVDVLRTSKFKGFTEAEVHYSLSVCRHLQLNPLLNQIHFVKRGNAVTAQVGIDGFRLAAQRTSQYAGSDEAVFEEKDSVPVKATVTVYRMINGHRCPFTASARWSEYKPSAGDHMWKKMPFTMLAKCAEALALRKAFPAELSDLYSNEEMEQANAIQSKAESLNANRNSIVEVETESKPDLGEYVCRVGKKYVNKKLKDIPLQELKDFCSWIQDLNSPSDALLDFEMNANKFLESEAK